MNKTSHHWKTAALLASCLMAVSLCGTATVALAEDPSDPVEAAQDSRTISNLRWAVTGSNTATVSWDAVTGARYYVLWVMKDGVHTQTYSLQTNSYSLTIAEPGTYGFAVGIAQTAGGSSSSLINARDTVVTVSLDPNNGQAPTPVGMLVEAGQKLKHAPATPSWGSNSFKGWTTSPVDGALAPTYDFSGWGAQVTAPITLTAQWQLAAPASVGWSADHARIAWDGVEGANGYQVTVTSASGETLLDDRMAADARSTACPALRQPGSYTAAVKALGGRGVANSADTRSVSLHTVIFDVAGGSGAPAMELVEAGGLASRPADPVRAGYRFDGWYAKGSSAPYDFASPVSAPVELVARWSVLPCKVQLNLNGGTLEGDDVTSYVPGTAQPLPGATHVGCTFGGWYDNAQLTGQPMSEIPATATGDQAFWAKWSPNTYLVYLDPEGGKILDRRLTHYTYGTGLILPQMVVRPGYTFEGWYTSSGGGDAVEEIPETATGNLVYYAHWKAVEEPSQPDEPQAPGETQGPEGSQTPGAPQPSQNGAAGSEGVSRQPGQASGASKAAGAKVSPKGRAERGLPATGDEGFSAAYGLGALAVLGVAAAVATVAMRRAQH